MTIRGDISCGVHYRVHSTKVKSERWYLTKQEAIAAFERACKRLGISPPAQYPPSVSGDSITNNDIACCAAAVLLGRMVTAGVYVEVRNN